MISLAENSSKYETISSGVPAVERALDILELLENAPEGAAPNLTEIAARLELPKASAHRLLATLRARGYIEQESGGGRGGWSLGFRVVGLAARAPARSRLVRAADTPLRALADATGEGAQLSVRSGDVALCVARVASPSHPEIALMGGVGAQFPLHAVAVGKVLLAYAPDAERRAYLSSGPLRAFTANTVTDADALERELGAIRAEGIAWDREEYKRGLYALAAPIRDASGEIRAAIALPLLSAPDADGSHETALRRAARDISHALGWRQSEELS